MVESLCEQTVKADEIILYLSLEEFPREKLDIPIELREMDGRNRFRIEWVQDNLKSHKKYYYALQAYRDDIVITVDDDIIYARSMIDDLLQSHRRFPKAVSARRARVILKNGESLENYCNWKWKWKYLEEYIDVPRMDLCAIGVGGVCYPPFFADDRLLDRKTMFETAEKQDDLWLKYVEIINSVPVVYTKPSQEDIVLEDSQQNSLFLNNVYHGANDQCVHNLLVMLKAEKSEVFQKWFQNLLDQEGYMMQKKRYYANVFNTVIDKAGDIAVYFYGAGRRARYMLMILSDLGLTQRITSIIVSERLNNPSELYGLQVRQLADIDADNKFGIILGVNEANKAEIENRMTDYDYQYIEFNLEVIGRYYSLE